ncbi:hypothetical protein FA15DRAFT_274379 [Coprinopsis marcescibilis]|uniref:Uncharacterized protein n=1 Tax=Coprinopsis marcescibilis TaxID=230819 RepID=A0A5C3KDR1_COPMA|nr:hypothetical protein FA15DRAFT_274379 [Coprinopsis marcescibilis]
MAVALHLATIMLDPPGRSLSSSTNAKVWTSDSLRFCSPPSQPTLVSSLKSPLSNLWKKGRRFGPLQRRQRAYGEAFCTPLCNDALNLRRDNLSSPFDGARCETGSHVRPVSTCCYLTELFIVIAAPFPWTIPASL